MTVGSPIDDPVVVTGMGCLSAAGEGVDALWGAVLKGTGLARAFDASPSVPACAVPAFELDPDVRRTCRGADRLLTLGLSAAVAAVKDAGCSLVPGDPRLGVYAGTSRGPVSTVYESWQRQDAGTRFQPSSVALGMTGSLAGTLALHFNSSGPSVTLVTGCTSGATAIASAADQLLLGRIDVAVAGGAEAPLHPVLLQQFESLGMLDTRSLDACCRPFDADRAGTVLGEGAAFLVLERLSGARARGATVHGILKGWALGSDVSSARAAACPFGSGLSAASMGALEMAGVPIEKLGWICAHGTGTRINDPSEANAFRQTGARDAGTPVSSIKPVTGHCLGASPALESIVCLSALKHRKAPPTPNLKTRDPVCDGLNFISSTVAIDETHVLNANQGFFGVTSALCFSRP